MEKGSKIIKKIQNKNDEKMAQSNPTAVHCDWQRRGQYAKIR